jgi:cobyrinic acid a,c-diamide synthase
MCGAIAAEASMSGHLTLGYRRAVATADSPVAAARAELRGHEFHYSVVAPAGDALAMTGRNGRASGGFSSPTLLASYLHLHLGADPTPAERFVRTASVAPPQRAGSR